VTTSQKFKAKAKRSLVPFAYEIADEKYRAKFLNGIDERVELHPGQIQVTHSLLNGVNVVVSCGRKWGKSFCVQYVALRKAVLFKKAYVYVILPFAKQAKEIYWQQLIIPEICPDGFIDGMNKGDMRITFTSGSFIKFDGGDNPELHRGPAVHLFICDELKDCDPKLMPAMMPNLLSTRGNFGVFGTPPDEQESDKAKMWFEMMERPTIDRKTVYYEGRSEDNPYNDVEALKREKERLLATGQEDVWLREYCGKYKRSQVESIFPMWADKHHVAPVDEVLDEARQLADRAEVGDFEYWLVQDPGSSSVFGQLYLGYYKPLAMIYVLDEAYVTDPRKATVLEMYRVELAKCGMIEPDMGRWINLYDEQASWFLNERIQIGANERLIATDKNKWRVTHQKDLKAGLTTARDILSYNRLKVADRCEHFIAEMRGYKKSLIKRKGSDHLIDCFRYFILKSYYSIPKEVLDDLSMIPEVVRQKVKESSVSKDLTEDMLDAMEEQDISEYMIAEALQWDGF
jgi:hypothetical protein